MYCMHMYSVYKYNVLCTCTHVYTCAYFMCVCVCVYTYIIYIYYVDALFVIVFYTLLCTVTVYYWYCVTVYNTVYITVYSMLYITLYSYLSLSVSSPQIWDSETGEGLVTCKDSNIRRLTRLALSGGNQRVMALGEGGAFTVSNSHFSVPPSPLPPPPWLPFSHTLSRGGKEVKEGGGREGGSVKWREEEKREREEMVKEDGGFLPLIPPPCSASTSSTCTCSSSCECLKEDSDNMSELEGSESKHTYVSCSSDSKKPRTTCNYAYVTKFDHAWRATVIPSRMNCSCSCVLYATKSFHTSIKE